jgi:Mg2+-importing ATPase
MIALPISCAAIGTVLPFSPLAQVLGFTRLPLAFFLILIGMILTYLTLVEAAKARFYGSVAHPHKPPTTPEQRHVRHVGRRAARFTRHRDRAIEIQCHGVDRPVHG